MINSVGIAGQPTIEESGSNLKGQVFIMGTMIALLFFLMLTLVAPLQADAAIVDTVAHNTISRELAAGNYTLTVFEDNSLVLSWVHDVAAPAEAHRTGAWINAREGSIGINR
jgi:hypothetical protein